MDTAWWFRMLLAHAAGASAGLVAAAVILPLGEPTRVEVLKWGLLAAGAALVLFYAWPTRRREQVDFALLSDRELCPACLQPNRTTRHFCRRCGAPVSATTTMLPFESIKAEYWALGTLARVPRPSRLQWVAALLIFVPWGLFALSNGGNGWGSVHGWADVALLGWMVIVGLVYLALFAAVVVHRLRRTSSDAAPDA